MSGERLKGKGERRKEKAESRKEKSASKREQYQTCLNYAEREQSQDRKSGIKGESRKQKGDLRSLMSLRIKVKGER